MLSLTSITELLCVFCMLPLAHTNIRAWVDSKVSCSDASMSGGGICISKGITQHGLDALTECQHAPLDSVQFSNPEDEKIGTLQMKSVRIICVGLFDGLGGLRVSLQKLHLYVVVILYISSEIDRPAKRCVRK